MTLEEAQASLSTIQAAIQSLTAGKTVSNFIITDGNFKRDYKYVTGDLKTNLEALKDLRDEMLGIINTLSPTNVQTFRTSVYPNIITKR